jgi:8-oxo-dGTP pyrophosphatase MutT (NUDIX family)
MENKEIHVLARGVIIDQDHILLCKALRRDPSFYFLPGGHVEHEESAANALVRELTEESGFNFEIERFLGCFEYTFVSERKDPCHSHEYNLLFEAHAKNVTFSTKVPQLEENIILEWVPLSTLNQIDFRPASLLPVLNSWLKKNLDQAFQSHLSTYQ